MKKLFVLTSLLCLLLCIGCTQEETSASGSVSGTVVSSDTEEPVPGAEVSITPGDKTMVTGSDGIFQFENLDPGDYTLTFSCEGYSSRARTVSVDAGSKTTFQISLEFIAARLSVTPESLNFGSVETTLSVKISNTGKEVLEWEVSKDILWASCSPTSGTTSSGGSATITVSVNRDKLDNGDYSGTVDIKSNGGDVSIPVSMEVAEDRAPTVNVVDYSDATYNSVILYGNIESVGNNTITHYGFCWSDGSTPTIGDNAIDLGECSLPGDFHCTISGLNPETKYWFRTYAENSIGLSYSRDILSFMTTGLPTTPEVTSGAVSEITAGTAVAEGSVTSLGNVSTVSAYGHVWGTGENPTLETGRYTDLGETSEPLSYTSDIDGLAASTTYYVRAYATNEQGTSYGDNVSFNTLAVTVPELGQVTVSGIGRTAATVSSTIVGDGNATVTECGFCWSDSPYPTIYDSNKVPCDVSTSFTATLTDLPRITTIYVRAYAINSKGTGYSEEASFTTSDVDVDTWDGTSVATAFGGGAGSATDPVIINSADQLKFLANKVNGGTVYSGVYFRLDVNIDLADHTWKPIGSSSYPFAGVFDGNGKTVSGICTGSAESSQGLFGRSSGTIENLTVDGTITGIDNIGGIVGYNTGSIISCTNKAEVSATRTNAGGIAGSMSGISALISDSSNTGAVSGADNAGGICGLYDFMGSAIMDIVPMYNCCNMGAVTSSGSAGGIIGYASLTNSSSDWTTKEIMVNVNNCCNIATISGTDAGGICGDILLSGSQIRSYNRYVCLSLNNCCSNSDIQGSSRGGLAAGVDWEIYRVSSTASNESLSEAVFTDSYWLFDVLYDIGLQASVGSGTRYTSAASSWYGRTVSGCYYENSDDIVTLLNGWVGANYGEIFYKTWTYGTVDGYACPVFSE